MVSHAVALWAAGALSWICLLIARWHVTELSGLEDDERREYLFEMSAGRDPGLFPAAKLNYELLGNQVPHLHWHLFLAIKNDPDATKPVLAGPGPCRARC